MKILVMLLLRMVPGSKVGNEIEWKKSEQLELQTNIGKVLIAGQHVIFCLKVNG